jgi:hypothetical protein
MGTQFSDAILSLLLSTPIMGLGATAPCETVQPMPFDLTTWSVIQYGPFSQPPAVWILTNDNTVAVQTNNADGSILLSPFALQYGSIKGSLRVDTFLDDDFMGFVFGYQDRSHFYLFDWKQADQITGQGALAKQGMSLKVVHADLELTETDFYATFPPTTNRVRNLYYNTNIWEDFVDYEFTLEFFPSQFTITVVQAANAAVVAQFTINDNTYTNGQFGFYGFSQAMVRYSAASQCTLPGITVADASVTESDDNEVVLQFNVSLTATSSEPALISYMLAAGSAIEAQDFTGNSFGTLIFGPGETNQAVRITVLGDRLDEADETVLLYLTNAVNAVAVTGQAVGTIIDNDSVPTLTIGDVSVQEGSSGSTMAVFGIRLSGPSGRTIEVGYSTSNVTAIAEIDYESAPPSFLTINPGQLETNVAIAVHGDAIAERDETFLVCLFNPINVALTDQCGTGRIVNDDPNSGPTVTIIRPEPGAFFYTPPGIVTIEAEASDVDGIVSQVSFYADGLLLDSIAQAPYVTRWTNTVSGSYTLTAVAMDAVGSFSTSSPVHIVIGTCDAPESQYALEISSTRGGIVVPDPFCEKYPPGTVVQLAARPAAGWQFLGWFGDVSGTNDITTVVIRNDVCVYAAFGTPLTARVEGEGNIIIDPPARFYPYGHTARLTAVPKTGSYFVRWSGDAVSTNNPLALVIDNGTPTVTALFASIPDTQHSYTVVPIGRGRVARPRANAFDAQVLITNTPLAEAGQQFLYWSGDTNGSTITSSNLVVRIERNRTIYAHFTPRPRLDVITCGQRSLSQGFRIRITGEFGAGYLLEHSSDMDVWDADGIGNIVNTPFGLGEYLENQDGLADSDQRYYRAREEGLPGLVAFYPFTGNARDLTVRGNHGTVNAAFLTEDRFGVLASAYEFNGVNSFIEIPDSDVFDAGSYTISFWFNAAALPSTPDLPHEAAMLFSKGRNHFEIHLGTPPFTNAGVRFLPTLLNPTTGQVFDARDVTIGTNTWHHLVAVYDGDSINAQIYLNGQELSLIPGTGPDRDDDTRFPARVGMRYNGTDANSGVPFKGKLDELRIFNRVLNAAEVQTLFTLQH